MTANPEIFTAGIGYKIKESVPAEPGTKLIAEDEIQAMAGPATVTASLGATFVVGTAGTFTVITTGTPTPTLSETGQLPTGVGFKDNGNGTGALSGTRGRGRARRTPSRSKCTTGWARMRRKTSR